MYKLNSKSKLIRFYNWLWNTDATKYKTMCPFFWGYLCTIIILPFILLVKLIYFLLPAKKQLNIAAEYISETKVGKTTSNITETIISQTKLWYIVGKIFKWIMISIFALYLIVGLIFILYQFYLHPVKGFVMFGVIILFLTIVFGIIYLFQEKKIGYYIKKPFIFAWDMIYSLYKNFCPLIIWDNKVKDK